MPTKEETTKECSVLDQQSYLKPEYIIIPVRDVLKAPPNNLTPKRETYYVEFGS